MVKQFKLLGSLEITQDKSKRVAITREKGLALLVYLIVTKRPQRREHLADLLWDADTAQKGLQSLRQLLTYLRRELPELLEITRQQVRFTKTDVEIDLYKLEQGLASRESSTLAAGLSLYSGDLLVDFFLKDSTFFNEWLTVEREHLRQRVIDGYRRLCPLYQDEGDWMKGLVAARQWLVIDEWEEDAHFWLMYFLAAGGQHRAAIAQYEQLGQILMDGLGFEPSPKTAALYEEILAQQPTGGGALPPMPASVPVPQPAERRHDWGEAPAPTSFFGRDESIAQLEHWLFQDRTQLISILGMGGQGKTTLTAHSARSLTAHFDGIYWRSLLNAIPFDTYIQDLLRFLSRQQITEIPAAVEAQIALVQTYLQRERFLLVLDNVESILQTTQSGQYRKGYEPYGQLLWMIGHSSHQSCLIFTSREIPNGLTRPGEKSPKIQSWPLPGLAEGACAALLQDAGISAPSENITQLIQQYSGNPLALKLIVQTIQDYYAGDVTAFLGDETPIFGDIQVMLDQQFKRLSPQEQEIILWLAIAREAQTVQNLSQNLLKVPRQRVLLEALRGLERRSLLEKSQHGFILLNVVTEYLTDRLIEQISREIITGKLDWTHQYLLQQSQVREYIRQSQERLLLNPVAETLAAAYASASLPEHFSQLLNQLRSDSRGINSYAASNLLMLLLHLHADITGFNFSSLSIRRANLQRASLPDVNFSRADFSETSFSHLFGFIYSVCFSPNGRLLAAASGDGHVILWDTATNQLIHNLSAHAQSAWAVTFSPDSSTLASTGADGLICLWDVHTGTLQKQFKGHSEGVHAVAFSPDGQQLASAGEAHRVFLWDTQTGENTHILHAHNNNVLTVAFSPDGRTLATGGRDHAICLWDISSLSAPEAHSPQHTLRGHNDWVTTLVFAPDRATLASSSADGTINLWNLCTGEIHRTLLGHSAGVHSIAFSPDGQTIASGSNDFSVRLWQSSTGEPLHTFQGHTNWVYSVAFSPDGQYLASGSWDHSIRLWDVPGRCALQVFYGHMKWVFHVAFSPDGQTLVSGSADKKVRLWQFCTGQICRTLHGHKDWAWTTHYNPDGTLIASGGMDHSVRVWDPTSGIQLRLFNAQRDGVQCTAFHPDGSLLAVGDLDHTITIYDLPQDTTRALLKEHTGWVLGLAFNPNGQLLASSSSDHTIRLWGTRTWACLKVLKGHTNGVQQVVFSPDGVLLGSAGWDKYALIWDIAQGKVLHRLGPANQILRTIAFSPDGKTVATGGNDQILRLWDAATGDLIYEYKGHQGWIFHLAFSPDGKTIATGSGDETIRIWDTHCGRHLASWPIPGPYAGMNITGATGLSATQKTVLLALGAVG